MPKIPTSASEPRQSAETTSVHDRPAGESDEARRQRIAEAAYYRAERRGFEPGRELDDWCEAEEEEPKRETEPPGKP
jgi:hypothetical protein